jgi:hypothetical protein
MAGYLLIVGLCCVTTSMTALFCSTIFSKTSTSLISSYLILVVLFAAPVAGRYFAKTFFRGTPGAQVVEALGTVSPFAATFALPLDIPPVPDQSSGAATTDFGGGNLVIFFGYVMWSLLYNGLLLAAMVRLFQVRWRVSE